MNRFFRNVTACVLTGTVLVSSLFVSVTTFASPNVLYNKKTFENITKGVTYELSSRLTDAGWVDVNVLKINLEDPNISIAPVQSTNMGLKEPLVDLLYENGAIAGVNSDFFGLKGTYSVSFGTSMKDGSIIASSDDRNNNTDDYPTFFLNNENNPFIDFMKINFEFFNDGVANVPINAINKAGDQVYAMKFDRNGGQDTASLDSRFSNLVKLVIENDIITYISQKGETVNVPENGYLIVMNGAWFDERVDLFSVNQAAEFRVNASLDLNNMKMCISGGAKILDNGQQSEYPGALVSPNSRQPRTAIGITEDKKNLILMVVDGRTHSIGATQDELADLLLEYGAYEAMNFDGGGSSTMVAKTTNDEWLTIKNTLSDGAQRKIINGLGVFNNSTAGQINQLVIKPSQKNVFKGSPVSFDVFGYDEYFNRIEADAIILSSDDENGKWEGKTFIPSKAGDINIKAEFGDLSATEAIKSLEMAEIKLDINSVALEVGESVYMNISGIDYDGFEANINQNAVSFEVTPNTLGVVQNGTFIASSSGQGHIKCTVGNAVKYIPVLIGSTNVPIASFENTNIDSISFSSSADTVQGTVEISSDQVSNGSKAIKLNYTFSIADNTQAAYLDFKNPIEIADKPNALELDVYGNSSNQWLRGRVLDSAGRTEIIDFAKNVDWEGYKTVRAKLPSNLSYPIKLDRIYIAALSSTDAQERSIYIDNLQGIYSIASNTEIPESTTFKDKKRVNLQSTNLPDSYDITVLPKITADDKVKPANYADIQSKVFEKFKRDSALGIFAGDANVAEGKGVIKYSSTYKISEYSNTAIVQMTATNGGLKDTFPEQWQVLEPDILSLDKDNIIIIIDRNPLNFKDSKEKELFKEVMEKIYNTHKNVFVISSSGTSNWITIENGIRYINLCPLFNTDGSVNEKSTMLRFRISGNAMYYDFE